MDGLDSENHVDGSRSQPSRYGIQGPMLFWGYMPKRAAAVVARQEQRSFSNSSMPTKAAATASHPSMKIIPFSCSHSVSSRGSNTLRHDAKHDAMPVGDKATTKLIKAVKLATYNVNGIKAARGAAQRQEEAKPDVVCLQ